MESVFWLTQTLSDVPGDDLWLSSEEQKINAKFRYLKRRNDWRLGRWTAKQAIVAYQGRSASSIPMLEIRSAKDGAPEAFQNSEPAPVSISISHSRDRGFCAVSSKSTLVGCDLEWIEPREENFERDYFTPEENSWVLRAPLEKMLSINLIWSAKEACLKVLRTGLSRDTRSICIHPDFREPESSWNSWTANCLESSRIFHGWWRSADGYVYTIAAEKLGDARLFSCTEIGERPLFLRNVIF
jgi:4'-phosphopantetheinyl transferase